MAMGADKVILLVDDDRAVLEAMQMLLQGRGGYVVHCAVGAAGAAAFLSRHAHVDVIVADVILAGRTTGVDLCELGRRLHPQLGLVVISADPKVEADMIPESSLYLRKPFGGDDLVAAIEQSQRLAGRHSNGTTVSS